MKLTGENRSTRGGGGDLSQWHFGLHKSYMEWPGIEHGPLRLEAGGWRPETWHGPNSVCSKEFKLAFDSQCVLSRIFYYVDITKHSFLFQSIIMVIVLTALNKCPCHMTALRVLVSLRLTEKYRPWNFIHFHSFKTHTSQRQEYIFGKSNVFIKGYRPPWRTYVISSIKFTKWSMVCRKSHYCDSIWCVTDARSTYNAWS
jgi:hypothetical protein